MKKKLFFIAVTALSICLSGCGNEEQTPTQAFNEWKAAIVAGKIDAANKLTADELSFNAILVEAVKDNEAEGKILKSGSIIGEDVKGDKAIIKMKGADGKTTDFMLVKSQGMWKLSHKESK